MSLAIARPELSAHIRHVVTGQDLTQAEAFAAISAIVQAEASPALIAALLIALTAKGETAEELTGAAQALRKHSLSVKCARAPLLDVCGTGGDNSGTFNVSTAVALVLAGAGVAVAKHGNRAMSSSCGSADVLEAMGVNILLQPERAADLLDRYGIAFLFAQHYHPAMRHVAAVRRELGVRTLFNFIGPLTNPANPTHQIVGVAHHRALPLVATALQRLGCRRGAVVHAQDGLDEISPFTQTDVIEWSDEFQRAYTIDPREFGFSRPQADALAGGDALYNAALLLAVLTGERGPRRDVVVLNAALAAYVVGCAPSLREGIAVAQHSIDSGAARAKLHDLVRASNA